ncbi:MAG: C40 family peptidase [Mucilaginibacter polytrichastri]|nr:C40 family peptidase [Mucilaginibacter polytrichastri]
MNHVICLLPVIPVRAEAAHRSEQTTQMLFGDEAFVLEHRDEWSFIELSDDSYRGWVQTRQLTVAGPRQETRSFVTRAPKLISLLKNPQSASFLVPAGCTLPVAENGYFLLGDTKFSEVKKAADTTDFHTEVAELAKSYLHVPYQWGGRTHFGIDCSGFAQIVYKMLGKALPRDAWQQAERGRVVDFLQEIQPGDLAFFDNEEGRITHVGIMLDPETIIHASSSVRIERMDNQGIYADDLKAYSHKLRIVKRIHI